MRAFIVAVVVMVVIAVGAALVLDTAQKPADVAFATKGARVDPMEIGVTQWSDTSNAKR